MTARPYFKSSVVELEAEAKTKWDSLPALMSIIAELKHRTTPRAQRLERDIARRIVALGGTLDGPAAPPGASSRAKDTSAEGDTLRQATMRAFRAEQRVRELEERLRAAEAELARRESAQPNRCESLYAKVGLHSSCPEFVLKAVRRAYRKEYHPDALSDRPRAEQLAAQEKFKNFEVIFDRIERLRQ